MQQIHKAIVNNFYTTTNKNNSNNKKNSIGILLLLLQNNERTLQEKKKLPKIKKNRREVTIRGTQEVQNRGTDFKTQKKKESLLKNKKNNAKSVTKSSLNLYKGNC